MFKLTLRNLAANRRRLVSTFLGVLLGVAFLAGTLVLRDTVTRTFDELFADVNEGTDAWVRSDAEIGGQFGSSRARIDESLVDTVAGVDGVRVAQGTVQGFAQIVGSDGEPIGNPAQGAPTFGGNWTDVDELNPFNLAEGRPPKGNDEVVIDKKSADDGKLDVGDGTTVVTPTGPVAVEVVGIARFGEADSPGGASFALFTLKTAQRYVAQPGKLDAVAVVADDGVTERALVGRVEAVLPADTEAITGDALTKENQDDIQQGVGVFTSFLTSFAGIALLVTTFSIYNTFSIIVAQRTRQMALLRAIGASRGQTLGSVLMEALGIGALASVLGLVIGVGVAGLLKGLLAAFGFDIPAGGTVLSSATVITCLVVGIVVTVVAALVPAVKAARVPPIAVMREVAVESSRPSKLRVVLGLLITAFGILQVVAGLFADTPGEALKAIGFGAAILIISTLVLGPVMARPITSLLARPVQAARGITGRLARENAMRNPKRTAGSASALLIGVAVVALFTVFAASVKSSAEDQIERSFGGDLVIDSGTMGVSGFSPAFAKEVNELPELAGATGLGFGGINIEDDDKFVAVVDPATVEGVFDLDVAEGSLTELDEDGVGISDDIAVDKGYRIGTELAARYPDGAKATLRVVAIYRSQDVAGNWTVGRPAYAAHALNDVDAIVLAQLADGVSLTDGKRAVEAVAGAYPGAEVQDRAEFTKSQTAQIDLILGLVYTMLALAIIIALLGIANTLSLSVFERTRELGLLRAVGMTRGQLRSTVRWESVVISTFGAVGGLGLGVFLGWALVRGAGKGGFTTFTLPVGSLLGVLVIAALAGVVAGLRAASKAAKLDVLHAIGAE